jgi:hypothetical protein
MLELAPVALLPVAVLIGQVIFIYAHRQHILLYRHPLAYGTPNGTADPLEAMKETDLATDKHR